MAAVTLSQVAHAAGVSQATASRVLNGSTRVPGEDVAERVRSTAERLGYVANAQAQALARSSTRLLGLVVQDIADPYFSSIARGVQAASRELQRQVLLASSERDLTLQLESVLALIAHRADAIIMAGSLWDEESVGNLRHALSGYADNGGRVATIGQPIGVGRTVEPANSDGAAELADALVDAGHSRFAIICGPAEMRTSKDRVRGFTASLTRHGFRPEAIVSADFSRDGGFDAAGRLIEETNLPGSGGAPLCVFAASDVMAIGAIAGWRARGIGVPRDVAVAGFDDIPTLRDHTPHLTSVELPLEWMGRQAARLALSGSESGAANDVIGEAAVRLRESTSLAVNSGRHGRRE
ncbi:LacI family DNA-binding transcriptional regulator [Spelaeicoccus albus]|uniref:LacI family transcriptional regulator n=2 Tax=Spelaeicoccus albus TaxID=1280376 RepID=A0A7Z0ACI7_9MICO|nr:LacI family DNA-binding transcriptional regulator [Spelaeicoccus albus]NYI66711.1 LacI family transcriptional regulator [Spelaeicoccus albus]